MPKVHFDESPGETFSFEQEDGLRSRKKISEEMLRLSPNEFLTFSKGEASDSNVEITCTSQIPVIYKIQTTSPEKFRVRPRCGILNPGDKVAVSILLKPDHHLSESLKDKFLVMCLPAPPGVDVSSPQNMSEAWKHKQSNSSEVEQHRLCCVYKGAGDNVLNGYSGGDETAGKGSGGGANSNLSIQAKKLEKQLKLMQILQYVTLVFLLILSVAVIYLLKLQTASTTVLEEEEVMAEADVLGLASYPGTGKSL